MKKLQSRAVEMLVIIVFLLLSLRVINWFEYPYVVAGGDFRPPLVKEAFINRVLYAWNEIDFGIPSVYSPRILDPFYSMITLFQIFSMDLFQAQIATVFLMYFFSSILVYIYVKQLTDGDVTSAFVAALFFTANIHLVVDREQTAIGFINLSLMILPSLVTFTKGIRTKSYKLIAVSGILFVLTYGFFPNYRVALLCFLSLGLTTLYFFATRGIKTSAPKDKGRTFNLSLDVDLLLTYSKYLLIFITACLLASLWIVTLLITNYANLFGSYSEMAAPSFVLYIKPHDVLRLIAKWSFYEGALGQPYVSYGAVYMQNPLVVFLSYLPPLIAFSSLLANKSRKLSIYFSIAALASLLLTSGLNPYFSQLYFAMATHIPLMLAFREPTNWIFLVVLSYSVLIGVALSTLCRRFRNRGLQLLVIGLAAVLFLSSSYPLVTGDVTRNWLNPSIKGSYLPSSYAELNDVLSSQFWAILLPQRSTYVVYNFTEGPFGSGNPYPLIFSKPVLSGSGTEYVQSDYLGVVNKIHDLIRTSLNYRNVALEAEASASSTEGNGFGADEAVDGQKQTVWSSQTGFPQWLEVSWNRTQEISRVKIESVSSFAGNCTIEAWNGTAWIVQATVNNIPAKYEYTFREPVVSTKLHLDFKGGQASEHVSISELGVDIKSQGVSKLLSLLSVKYLVLEKNLLLGNTSSLDDLELYGSNSVALAREWDEIALFDNLNASQKLYTADNLADGSTVDSMYNTVEEWDWSLLKHSAFVDGSAENATAGKTFVKPQSFRWVEQSPTNYEITVTSNGPFVLVFSESYDSYWRLYVNGTLMSEATHVKVNAFANGWVIDEAGNLGITLKYETQDFLSLSVEASIILPAILLIFLGRRDIRKLVASVYNRLNKR